MDTHRVKIQLSSTGNGSVEVDGIDLSADTLGLSLHASARKRVSELQLDLLLEVTEVEGEMVVTVPGGTKEALVALGWTPPEWM